VTSSGTLGGMDGYISIKDLAARMGVTPSRLRHMAHAGRLKAEKVGRDWLVAETEAVRFAALERKTGRPRRRPTQEETS